MTKIREEIRKVFAKETGVWLGESALDNLENHVRSWALEISQTLGQSTEGREDKSIEWNDGYITALFDVDAMIEENK